MERRIAIGMLRNGRQPHRMPTQRDNASSSRQGHSARMVHQEIASWPGIPISASRFQIARKARSCVCGQTESDLYSWVLLAFAWMQVRPTAQIKAGILASKATRQSEARCATEVETSQARLVRAYGMAMRNPASEKLGSKASDISRPAKRLNDRTIRNG